MPRNLKTAIPYILLGVLNIFELLVAQDPVIPYGGIHFKSSSYFERVPNSVIEGQHITSSDVYDAFACQVLCIRESRCLSFNFGLKPDENGLHLCEIFEIIRNYGDIGFIQADLFDFYTVPSVPRSCSHAKSLGYLESRNYIIDVDGKSEKAKPFQVYCDMRDKEGVGVTVVSHDSENRTEVSGCEPRGCYRRDVMYHGISDVIGQLGALTQVSNHCEQYIKWECRGAMILVHSTPPHAWLVSRDGRRLRYWGGAPPDSKMCACGVAGNCTGGGYCNCDNNSISIWLEDAGLLTYKNDLPITMLRFGDLGNVGEVGHFTLGKLRCYGQAA